MNVCFQFSSVQSLSHVRLFETPWIAARQASLSITNSRSLLKLMPIVLPKTYLGKQKFPVLKFLLEKALLS